MLNKFTTNFLFLSLFTCVASRIARAEAPFRMPCAQVIKLGPEKFMDVYTRKVGGSEADYDAAAGYYYRCMREHNDRLARRLPIADRKRVNRVREELKDLEESCTDLEYTAMGGGTMYGHNANREFAYREELLDQVIALMLDPPGMSADARHAAQVELASGAISLAKLAHVPNNMELKGKEYTQYRQQYLQAFAGVKLHWARLEPLVLSFPEFKGIHRLAIYMSQAVKGTLATLTQK